MERVNLSVKYEYTDQEIMEMSMDMSQAKRRWADLEDRKKSVAADYKQRIDNTKAEMSDYAHKIREGCEFRDVDCCVVRDFHEKEVCFIEISSGKLVEVREMPMNDSQMSIDDSAPAVMSTDDVMEAYTRLGIDEEKEVKITRSLYDLVTLPKAKLKKYKAAGKFRRWFDDSKIEVTFADDEFVWLRLKRPAAG